MTNIAEKLTDSHFITEAEERLDLIIIMAAVVDQLAEQYSVRSHASNSFSIPGYLHWEKVRGDN